MKPEATFRRTARSTGLHGGYHVPEHSRVRHRRRAGVAGPEDRVRHSRRSDRPGDDDPVARPAPLPFLSPSAGSQPQHPPQDTRDDQKPPRRPLTAPKPPPAGKDVHDPPTFPPLPRG